jgi:hypothetical protein
MFEFVLILAVVLVGVMIVLYIYWEPFHQTVNDIARHIFGRIASPESTGAGGG